MRTLGEQCAKLPRKCAKLRTAEFLGKGIYLAIGQALQNLRISSRNRNGFLDIIRRVTNETIFFRARDGEGVYFGDRNKSC